MKLNLNLNLKESKPKIEMLLFERGVVGKRIKKLIKKIKKKDRWWREENFLISYWLLEIQLCFEFR